MTIGGREIKLRRDGSFSFRFALPDGQYELPVAARSADGEETRQAELNFSRASQYQGGVEAHPQDKKLQPPSASASLRSDMREPLHQSSAVRDPDDRRRVHRLEPLPVFARFVFMVVASSAASRRASWC